MSDTLRRIVVIIARVAGVPVDQVAPDSLLIVTFDELDGLEILVAVEDSFDVLLDQESFFRCLTADELAKLVEQTIAAQSNNTHVTHSATLDGAS